MRNIVFVLIVFSFLFSGCGAHEEMQYYTAYNLWHNDGTIHAINYKGGELITAGTKIKDMSCRRHQQCWIRTEENMRYNYKFEGRYHPGKAKTEYFNRILTSENINNVIASLPEKKQKAIRLGIVIKGMTKVEVLIAYGYPPEHYTTSLKNDKWRYWIDRIANKNICFDSDNLTVECEKIKSKETGLEAL